MTCPHCGHEPAGCACGEITTRAAAMKSALREIANAPDSIKTFSGWGWQYEAKRLRDIARAALAQEGV